MNPRLLLALWRARWGKSPGGSNKVPYLQGKVNTLGSQMVTAALWSEPTVPYLAALAALFFFAVVCFTSLPLTNQIQFSVGILLVSLFIRRYSGLFVTLTLSVLALIMSSRYLIWRFGSTLATEANTDFLLGFALCSAELLMSIAVAVEIVRALWPQYRSVAALLTAPERWPKVDIFLLLEGRSAAEVSAMAHQAAAIDWPKKRRVVYFLDDHERADLREFAAARGARYLVHAEATLAKPDSVNHALPFSHGEFIAVFDGSQTIERTLLRSTIGWFVRDHRLGMLVSPVHFTVPPPTPLSVAQFNPAARPQSFAMFRRTMLTYVAGLTEKTASGDHVGAPHTALKLRAAGFRCAYAGIARTALLDQQSGNNALLESTLAATDRARMVRVDDPFSESALRYKQGLSDVATALAFYAGIPRIAFLIAPVLFLLADVNLIQTSPELLAAYALPHLLHGLIARARLRGHTRFSVEVDVLEGVLSVYLQLQTTLRLIRPGLSNLNNLRTLFRTRRDETRNWTTALGFGALVLLNARAVIAGCVALFATTPVQYDVTALYLLWSACNLMQLAAMLAIAEEARTIRHHHRQVQTMPAMLKLASGKTISCKTCNFPQPSVELLLPGTIDVGDGAAITLSLFHEHREYAFPARIDRLHESDSSHQVRLTVVIDADVQAAYCDLGAACFSRGTDWPQWLPGRNADRLIPVWLSRAVIGSLIAVLDFVTHSGQYKRWLRAESWTFLWNQKK